MERHELMRILISCSAKTAHLVNFVKLLVLLLPAVRARLHRKARIGQCCQWLAAAAISLQEFVVLWPLSFDT